MSEKKYYWLKLKRDFFKRHDIRIIEAMPSGKDFILFYLKMLCESIDHDGLLRFSDGIAYTPEMLATVTNTDVEVVRDAIKTFTQLGMMEILNDGTIAMVEASRMTGYETEWAEKKRKQRKRTFKGQDEDNVHQKRDNVHSDEDNVHQKRDNVLTLSDKSIDKDIDKDIDKECDIRHTHGTFNNVKLSDVELQRLEEDFGRDKTWKAIQFLDDYIEEKDYKSRNHYLAIKRWVFKALEERHIEDTSEDFNRVAQYFMGGES